jgi:hypothetical protein
VEAREASGVRLLTQSGAQQAEGTEVTVRPAHTLSPVADTGGTRVARLPAQSPTGGG